MYGVIYNLAGKIGIVDTDDGVIERIEKEKVDELVKNGVHIAGASPDGTYKPKIMNVAYGLMNYAEGNGNIFTSFVKHSLTKTSDVDGKFSLTVKSGGGKSKEYKGTYTIMKDCSKYGVAGEGAVLKFSINIITVIPLSILNSLE